MPAPAATELGAATRAGAGKYLTFRVGRESYGINVLKIREIIRLVDITAVPQMPAFIRGVINLRGKIIPVVDLRARFGLSDTQTTERTCIVVVQTTSSAGQTGVIVDAVEEVVAIAQDEIEATPDFGTGLHTDYIQGIAKIKSCVKALLDIDRVLAADSATAIGQTLAA